jgi:alpha-tubulin suppressor-like RCC1 family protein
MFFLFVLLLSSANASLLFAGGYRTCAIQSNGDLYCWGHNSKRQLGLNTTSTSNALTPVKMIVGSAVSTASLGFEHSCVVTNGTAKCVGAGSLLGDGTTVVNTGTMVQVNTSVDVRGVTCGRKHSCIISTSGVVSCFGSDIYGQLANGQTSGTYLNPVDIGYSGVLDVSTGTGFTCIVTSAGGVMCSGLNDNSQLGIANSTTNMLVMTTSDAGNGALMSGIAKVSCGYFHSCALSIGNIVCCWGRYGNGQIGTSNDSFAILGISATTISTGFDFTCGLFSGTLKCFGYNGNGQLGKGSSDTLVNPIPMDTLFAGNVTEVACGWYHTCTRFATGVVQCVGGLNRPYFGSLGSGLSASLSIVSAQGIPITVSPISTPTILPTTVSVCADQQ